MKSKHKGVDGDEMTQKKSTKMIKKDTQFKK